MSEETWQKVNHRRKLKQNGLNATTRQQKKLVKDQFSTADKVVKKNCKQDKRNYVEQLAQDAKNARNKGDTKTLKT